MGNTYPEPPLSVLGLHLLTVANPVAVPAPEGSRIMYTNGINTLNLKASSLKSVDDESKRSASIGARENVLVHEKTPDKILVLPGLAETSNLQEENTVIVKHVVNLRQECGEVADTDVLRHLETGDFLVASRNPGRIAVIGTNDTALRLINASFAKAVVTPGSLVTTESDTSDVGTIVNRRVFGERTPATAKVKDRITGLNTNLLTNNSHLVILQFFEGFFPVDVANQTGRVDHAGAQEPGVEVITSVVVVTHLFLILEPSVSKDTDNS